MLEQDQMREAMDTRCVLWKLCFWLALLTITAEGQNCPSGYRFTVQPPTELNCNPVGRFVSLQCATMSTADIVTWYWTQNVCEAGINGTAILPRDISDNYQVTSFCTSNRQISFTASESTLGYYWCEISNAVDVSLRPSTITPVLQPANMSLPACTNALVISSHSANPECAEEDSPTVHSRPPLPSSCVPPQLTSSFSATPTISVDLQTSTAPISTLVPSVVSSAGLQTLLHSTSTSTVTVSVPPTTSSPGSSTMIIVVIAVAVFIVLTALGLVLLLVIIWNVRRRRIAKPSARSTTGTLQSTSNGEDDVKMVQNEAYSMIQPAGTNMKMVQNKTYSAVTQIKLSQSEDPYKPIYYYSTLTAY